MGKMTDVIDITVPQENKMPKSENNAVQIFESAEFGKIRTVEINGDVWFVGADVASVLGYSNTRDAIRKHVDEEDKRLFGCRDLRRLGIEDANNNGMMLINESGVYSLIFRSSLPIAKKFKHYVTNEILPSVRKHGAYMTDEVIKKSLLEPDFIIKLATELKAEREQKNKLLIENKEVKAVNAVLAKENLIWTDRQVLNNIVTRYSGQKCNGNVQGAWRVFYSNLYYKCGININSRAAKAEKKFASKLDLLTDKEMSEAVKCMVSICEFDEVDIGDIIEKHWSGYEEYLGEEQAKKDRYEAELNRAADEAQRVYEMFCGKDK